MLSYGASAFVKSVTADLLPELLAVYPPQDAYAIMSVATLRVIKPSITSNRMSSHYRVNTNITEKCKLNFQEEIFT